MDCVAGIFVYLQIIGAALGPVKATVFKIQEAIMTRDELNRELRMHSATWQSVAVVYGAIVATLVLSAMSILA